MKLEEVKTIRQLKLKSMEAKDKSKSPVMGSKRSKKSNMNKSFIAGSISKVGIEANVQGSPEKKLPGIPALNFK